MYFCVSVSGLWNEKLQQVYLFWDEKEAGSVYVVCATARPFNTFCSSSNKGPCDQSFSAQPISTQKAHQEKNAHKPLRTSWISLKMCLPCLIIRKSCYFDDRINKPFTCSPCLHLHFMRFSIDPWCFMSYAQRIISHFRIEKRTGTKCVKLI